MRSGVYEVVSKVEFERLDAYLSVDLAHVVMLHDRGIATREVANLLASGLRCAYGRIASDPGVLAGHQSMLFAVESLLQNEVGHSVAGFLQTGRSRLDQSEAVRRLHYRALLMQVADGLVELANEMVIRATEWQDICTAGWTHLQQSQPWNMGHYMLGLFSRTGRDLERVLHCLDRTDVSALGAAAMVGTDWPVDRARVASLLGHRGVIANAMDASTQQADYPAEVASTLSLVACNMARWASDFYVWSSSEFGLLQLDTVHCGTSSIMPQKRNPIALARIRAMAGQSVGWMPAQLAIMKSPTSSDCDAFYASDTSERAMHELVDVIALGADVIRKADLSTQRCDDSLRDSWCTLSALSDALVRGAAIDFRTAHEIVAKLAKQLREQGRTPQSLDVHEVNRTAGSHLMRECALSPQMLNAALDPHVFSRSRTSEGGTAPEQIRVQLAAAAASIDSWSQEVQHRSHRHSHAAADLNDAVDRLALQAGSPSISHCAEK